MKVYLACRVFPDGDGESQVEPLEVFYSKDSAITFCIDTYIKENKERLFNADGSKKLLKLGAGIFDGVPRFRFANQPQIYYDYFDLAINAPDKFTEEYIKSGELFYIQEFQVK